MSAAHTPGPWVAEETAGGEWEVVQPDATKPTPDEPWYIALVYDCANGASAEDNARLIAAAPDMLEAMQDVMNILGRAESNASGNPEWDDVGPRVAKFRAAITKATGQEGGAL